MMGTTSGPRVTTEPDTPRVHAARQTATLGGGCFWCLEAVFTEVPGVAQAVCGYAGGTVADPTYAQVCAGTTGHVEVVQIAYDPETVAYGDLLDLFFTIHDPTSRDRQGGDVGPQYRSVIFWQQEEERGFAERKIAELNASRVWSRDLVTEVRFLEAFYRAEDHHQGYFARHPNEAYCAYVVAPKVTKARSHLGR
jgi:peptide-methionine (S)-S-oxide reductase